MHTLEEVVHHTYGHKPRIRVCGVCLQGGKMLLVKHNGIGPKGYLWAPPGGGVEFGESMADTLIREFAEETNLEVKVGRFMFINEYIHAPLHAVELFFEVVVTGGLLQKGMDPEMPRHQQLIGEVRFIAISEILKDDPEYYHNMFRYIKKEEDIHQLQGYYSTR